MAVEQVNAEVPASVQSMIFQFQTSMQVAMHEMELRIVRTLEEKHKENRLMNEATRDSIQAIVNANYLSQEALARKVDRTTTMLGTVTGEEGSPGGGRLGKLETAVEQLKQFRWQALAVLALGMWLAEKYLAHR